MFMLSKLFHKTNMVYFPYLCKPKTPKGQYGVINDYNYVIIGKKLQINILLYI